MNIDQPEERSTAELFSQYVGLLLRWSWLLILMALLAGGVSYYFTNQQTRIYQASTLVMINASPTSQMESTTSVYLSQLLAETYAQVMTTQPVLDATAERLGLPGITAGISVRPIQNTQLLEVIVQDTDPLRAAAIANTLVIVFGEQIEADQEARYADSKKNLETQLLMLDQQIKTASDALNSLGTMDTNAPERIQLETSLAQYRQSYAYLLQSYEQIRLAEAQAMSKIIQKEPAIPSIVPIQPQPMRSALLAAVVGAMLAAGIIFLIEFLDDTIRDPQEITSKWGVPILGMIAHYKTNGSRLITVTQPRLPVSEAFRSLRTNLDYSSVDTPLKSILVTSPTPQDGKTTIAANLGCVMAQGERKVVVVDADLRRPQIHRSFQLLNRLGLTDQLVQSERRIHLGVGDQVKQSPAKMDGCLQHTEVEGLKVITSGSLPPDPSELLGSTRMQELLGSLQEEFDCVILDSPPVLVVTDAVVLAPRVSGVIVVVKPGVTKRAGFSHVIDQLRQVQARILGVVINDVNSRRSRYYYYRRYYSSYTSKYYKSYYSPDDRVEKENGNRKEGKNEEKKERFFL